MTDTPRRRTLVVRYPAGRGRIVLRTELDWEKNVEPTAVSDDATTSTFEVRAKQPHVYFKPCLVGADRFTWAAGPNQLLTMGGAGG